MNKFRFAAVGAMILSVVLAGSAFAASPHFIGTPSATVSSSGLTVTFKAAGLGNVSSASFTLSASSVSATYQCYTKSGNPVNGVPKTSTETDVSTTETFPVRNGQTTGSLSLTPPSPSSDLNCTGNQYPVLLGVTYYDVVLSGMGLTYSFGTVSA